MIFENNYIWPGVTAIIYTVIIDYDNLEFYTTENPNNTSKDNVLLPSDSLLEEIGIEWKKSSDNEWTQLIILNSNDLQKVKNGLTAENVTNLAKTDHIDLNKYVISSPVSIHLTNFISPIYVVIKDLDQLTSYTVRSYYIKNGSKTYYNNCTTTTFERKDIYYECTEVTGGTEDQNNKLKDRINEACYIYNAMTNFSKATTPGDNLGSKTGGNFSGTYDKTLANVAAAHSGMVFASYTPNLSTVCHEMAHNLMKNQIDEKENENAYNKIVKFMEFATHSPKATWRWQSAHNYPVISSATYTDAFNYLVAAACRVCRDASGLL